MQPDLSIAAGRADLIDRVPLIDFGPFLAGGDAGKRAVAGEIRSACETIGFLYLANHGVSDSLVARTFDVSRRFFALPQDILNDPDLVASSNNPRGYVPFNSRKFKGATHPDLRDGFHMETERPADDPDYLTAGGLLYPNRWPRVMPEFRATMLEYYDRMTLLAGDLLHAMALALDLPEAYFDRYFHKPLSSAALRHYPPQTPMTAADAFGIFPHKDEVAFTILAQDAVGGLQVRVRENDWVDAAPIPGTFVINIGDTMARWSNDRFASTWHRVVNRSGVERYSIPFFFRPHHETLIECLPTCQSPANPPKYQPVRTGENAIGRLQRDWTKKQ